VVDTKLLVILSCSKQQTSVTRTTETVSMIDQGTSNNVNL